MPARIPQSFIDQLLTRIDVVDVIDRRVGLVRKGKEYQACCPFHEEKTPSFTVSPTKQFYHCFGCGAHGTALGFLMDYGNLSFVEAVESLAETAGVPMPARGEYATDSSSSSAPAPLLEIIAEADKWFRLQLRQHADAAQAVDYLKGRGLDGRVAAEFGIGYAPDGWDNLVRALGDDGARCAQLLSAGLVARRDKSADNQIHDSQATFGAPSDAVDKNDFYDRFRNRIIFPIEDHRGRVVAFGGRVLGAGEPKYLNSPETPLFHKGAELYGLHRARREIGKHARSIVVEGYMDVVSLAQFGINHAVATLGTATTRTHVQRLFRVAPEIIFCFDGDRAGRDAAWKAMGSALPELQDGRQLGFLFLPDGEDPDSIVRAEGGDGFLTRAADALPLEKFLFDALLKQVDTSRMDGRARLVSLAKPLLAQLPTGALREMMFARLSTESGLPPEQLGKDDAPRVAHRDARGDARALRSAINKVQPLAGQITPLAQAISLLLQKPALATTVPATVSLGNLNVRGAEVLAALLAKITADPNITTARLLESFRDEKSYDYMQTLATRRTVIERAESDGNDDGNGNGDGNGDGNDDAVVAQFNELLTHLLKVNAEQQTESLIEKLRQQPTAPEAAEWARKIQADAQARNAARSVE